MRVVRVDAFDINYEECSALRKYKLEGTTGMGEKRIYVGHDEDSLDEFFDLDNIKSFIMLKKDLQRYMIQVEEEYLNPTQNYKEEISIFYEENVDYIDSIDKEVIELHFTKKYDSQRRYYLNFARDGLSGKNWNYFRNVALPRVTKLNFVKVKNIKDNALYIYIKPSFFVDQIEKEEARFIEKLVTGNKNDVLNYRKKQTQYRRELLELMPACIITKVAEDRILEACHIMPYSLSSDEEKYDVNNGLVMTPTYHKLFDMGFISFNDDGKIKVSPFLSNMNRKRLNLDENKQYRIPKDCAKYLQYHRNNIFNQVPDLHL